MRRRRRKRSIRESATWHPDESVTVNLKDPIIYNEKTRQARQVVPKKAAELSLAHPMGN